MNMREFNNWLQEKSEENVLESYEYIETNELMMPPKPGDIVLSQASAVFKTYQDRQGNWIQPKSRRDLYKTKTPMYVISGPPDKFNRYPAYIFSSSNKRNKKNLYINFENLHKITSAYSEEEAQGRNIWLWLKPNMTNSQKYKDIYSQWSKPQEPQTDPVQTPSFLQVSHYNPNERFWKSGKDNKVYESFPEE
jgi:hypothetical protein